MMNSRTGNTTPDTNGVGRPWPNGEAQPLDPRELLAAFWRRRWLIVFVMTAVLGVFAWRALYKVPEYRALGRIQVVREEPTVGLSVDVPAARLPVDPVNSEVQAMRSRSLLDAVADSLQLQVTLGASPYRRAALFPYLEVTDPVVPGEYVLAFTGAGVEVRDDEGAMLDRAPAGELLEGAGLVFVAPERPADYPEEITFYVRDRRSAGEEIYERLSASAVERTNLVDLSFRAYDPVLAADVLNAIMTLGRRQSVDRLREQAAARREFIEAKLVELERQLREAEADVRSYQSEIGAVSLESTQAGQVSNILGFERQVEELRLERQLYAPVLEGFRDSDASGDPNRFEALAATPVLIKNPAIADLYRRLKGLEIKRDSLVSGPSGAGPGNPAVQAVNDQIVAASTELVDALGEYMRGIDRQIVELRRTIDRLQDEAEGMLPHAAELARRQQRVETFRKSYETLLAQLEQARIEEASESGKLAIIDPAIVPREPINSTRASDLLLAVVLAAMLGFGSALVLDYFDDRVRSPREVRRNLGLTVLGVVPRFDPVNGKAPPDYARVHLEPRSAPAEAYRVIRTNLAFSLAARARHTLLVTSPGPGEGKTTTAANLAASLARQGERVVLMDADLRKANIHRIMGVAKEPGLTQILTGEATAEEVIVPGGIENLDILPCGPLPPNPAELLSTGRMTALLETLGRTHDRVIIDSPPVLAVADPTVLAQRTDGAIMVIRSGQTGRQALLEAMERLKDVGGDVLGVVVNALRHEIGHGGSYYYYYREGYYGESGSQAVRNRLKGLIRSKGVGLLALFGVAAAAILAFRGVTGRGQEVAPPEMMEAASTVDADGAAEPGAAFVGEGTTDAAGGSARAGTDAPVSTNVALPYSVAVASYRSPEEAAIRAAAVAGATEAPAYLTPADVRGERFYRVYAGALANREAAGALAARLVADGVKERVGGWDVRDATYAADLGFHADLEGALDAVEGLRRLGVPAYALAAAEPDVGAPGYRVYAGGYASPADATALLQLLADAGIEAQIVRRTGLDRR